MKCKVSFEFETLDEMTMWLLSKPATPSAKVTVTPTAEELAPEPVEAPAVVEPAPEPVEVEEPEAPKAGRMKMKIEALNDPPKAKVPPTVETLNPEAPTQKEREKALALLIGKIRGFVLADKATNMKALLPLMPDGKKALDKLTLEEAQAITLKLGID